ncbi:MAG: hypothetical protein ACTSQI_11495 [Candidatus Helarchaeota archaeon]
MPYRYGEIPDGVIKKLLPLEKRLWYLYRKLGWTYLQKIFEIIFAKIPELFIQRLQESIELATHFIRGRISRNQVNRILTYQLYPPFTSIRCDLQQGTMKLLHGDSCDITFVALRDFDSKIDFLINCHFEEGFPVDLWSIGSDSELLDEYHWKAGYKLRDLYSKTRKMTKVGPLLSHFLRKVRSECTPQFSQADYQLAMIMGSSLINLAFEYSSYECWGNIWDYMNAHRIYSIPDSAFAYVPCPPLINTFFQLKRSDFTTRLTKLTTDAKLYLQRVEEETRVYNKQQLPEAWLVGTLGYFKEGIPRPRHTLECTIPCGGEDILYNEAKFEWKYKQPNKFIHLEDIGLSLEEALEGVYLNITHETSYEEPLDETKIISTGIGLKTQFR